MLFPKREIEHQLKFLSLHFVCVCVSILHQFEQVYACRWPWILRIMLRMWNNDVKHTKLQPVYVIQNTFLVQMAPSRFHSLLLTIVAFATINDNPIIIQRTLNRSLANIFSLFLSLSKDIQFYWNQWPSDGCLILRGSNWFANHLYVKALNSNDYVVEYVVAWEDSIV